MSGKTAEKQQNLGKKSLNSEKKKKNNKNIWTLHMPTQYDQTLNLKFKCPSKTAVIDSKISIFLTGFMVEQKVMSKPLVSTDTQIHSLITLTQGLWIWNFGFLFNYPALLKRLVIFWF